LGDVGLRPNALGEKPLHEGAVAFGRKNFYHEVGGLGGQDGGRLPEASIGELEIEPALPWKNHLENLGPRGPHAHVRGAGLVTFRKDSTALQGRIEHPSVTGGGVGGQTNFDGMFGLGLDIRPPSETAYRPKATGCAG